MKILAPASLKKLELRNRLVWLPAVSFLADEAGYVTDALIKRLEDRAKGGFGLIETEAAGIDMTKSPNLLRIADDSYIPRLKELTDAVHKHDCKIVIQLVHFVKQSVRTGWKFPIEDFSIKDIQDIEQEFVRAAIRAREAGFDGVELHAAHGYTLASFLSLLNRRTDQYGGAEEGRGRIVVEILEKCRKELGNGYCIGLRISGEEFVIGGNTLKHTTNLSQIFAQADADFIGVSAGGKTEDGLWFSGYSGTRCMPPANLPDACHAYLARGIKEALGEIHSDCPVIVCGKIPTLACGESLLSSGKADLIGICRPALADPDWPVKQVEQRQHELKKCVYCNGCVALLQKHKPVFCVRAWR